MTHCSSNSNVQSTHEQTLLDSVALLCLMAAALLVWVKFFALLSFGFDLTDEGFYVQSAMNADSYHHTVSKFGALLAFFWSISSENLITYRYVFWLLLWSTCALVAWSFLSKGGAGKTPFQRSILTLCITASLVLTQQNWLPTPNYNSLGVLFLLFFSYGVWLLYATKNKVLSSVVIGVSGALLFLSKATSAAMLVVILITVLGAVSSKMTFKVRLFFMVWCGLSAAFTLCVLSILLFGGPLQFVQGLQLGLEAGSIMMGPEWGSVSELIWRGKPHAFSAFQASLIALICTVCGLVGMLGNLNGGPRATADNADTQLKSNLKDAVRWINLTLAIMAVCVCVRVIFYGTPSPLQAASRYYVFVLLWAAVLANCVGALMAQCMSGSLAAHKTWLVVAFLMMPYAYALGTASAYWPLMTAAWVFGVIICGFANCSMRGFLPIAMMVVIMAAFSLPINGNTVYRQPVLDANNVSEIKSALAHNSMSGVVVDNAVATYLFDLSRLAQQADFEKGTDVIDLTGASPGAISFLGGRAAGAAWMLGGYPGSDEMAKLLLDYVDPFTLKQAWVLHSDWRRSLSGDVLEHLGLDLQRDYVLVGQIEVPAGYGGRKSPEIQSLYKPKNKPKTDLSFVQ